MLIDDLIFQEKYKPKNLDEIILEDTNIIKDLIKDPLNIQSMLFYGKWGTGKSTTAELIKKELKADCLEINVSKDRGIDYVREYISNFVSLISENENCMKMVILQEAEMMTSQAIKALKELISKTAKEVFFIFTTNDYEKMDGSIKSRCVEINFNFPPVLKIKEKLHQIIKEEKLEYDDKYVENLISTLYPDLRAMIKYLQYKYKLNTENDLKRIKDLMKEGDYRELLKEVETLNIKQFVMWFFEYTFKNYKNLDKDIDKARKKARKIVLNLAEILKNINNTTLDKVITLAYLTEIGELIK